MHPTFRNPEVPCARSGVVAKSLFRALSVAVVLATLSTPTISFAAPKTTSQATPSRPTQPPAAQQQEKPFHELTPQERTQRVEERIRTLHDKLGITQEQEPRWQDVAQTMRDNEQAMSAAIDARRRNRATMNAIDDLKSYQEIAETHVDGIKKMISAFQPLYDDMSDTQKREADTVFNDFERRHEDGERQK